MRFALSSAALAALTAAALHSVPAHAQVDGGAVITRPTGLHYIVTRPDLRKCAFPMCGGYFVKAVNQPLTRCANGAWQVDCHVAVLDATALGWTEAQKAAFEQSYAQGQALVKGQLSIAEVNGLKADTLKAAEAWQGQALAKPAGTFYGVKSTGIVCITTPCPSLAAVKLNSPLARPFNPELDLAASGAGEAQLQAGYEALSTSGILTAGTAQAVKYPGLDGRPRWGSTIVASEFYLPAKP